MLFRYLIILFVGVPMLELFVLLEIGSHFGVLPTFLLVIITGIAGAYLAKSQGIKAWTRIQTEFARGNIPGDELMDGLMVFAGGITLLTPGLITDTIGLCFLIPPTRAVIKPWLYRFVKEKMRPGRIIIQNDNINQDDDVIDL